MAKPHLMILPSMPHLHPLFPKRISWRCWKALFLKIAEDVADGKIVYVGDYFTLQAGGSSKGEENEKGCNSCQYQKA